MKKIVKKSPKTFKAKCPKCLCKFTYEVEDIATNMAKLENFVACPSCGNFVQHNKKRLFVYKD